MQPDCRHFITQVVLRAASIIRELKGLPEEKNITTLYNEYAPILGAPLGPMSSGTHGSALISRPIPTGMRDKTGKLMLPAKDCPKCGSKQSVFPMSVCSSCEDWKNGYRSSWSCINAGCGYKELFKTPYTTLLDEVAPGWESGFKKDMGIKTLTAEGVK